MSSPVARRPARARITLGRPASHVALRRALAGARGGGTVLTAVVLAASLMTGLSACDSSRPTPLPDTRVRLQLADLHMVAVTFRQQRGEHPRNARELAFAVQETGWDLSVLRDPWNRSFIYRAPRVTNPAAFDLCSRGPDGEAGTADDICVLNAGTTSGPLQFGATARDRRPEDARETH
jgi:hypothetical protein